MLKQSRLLMFEVPASDVSEREVVCPGFGRMSSFRVTKHAAWVVYSYCGSPRKSACIAGVLLQMLLKVC
jgi:hypothetical protein